MKKTLLHAITLSIAALEGWVTASYHPRFLSVNRKHLPLDLRHQEKEREGRRGGNQNGKGQLIKTPWPSLKLGDGFLASNNKKKTDSYKI